MDIDEIEVIGHSFIAGVYAKQVRIPNGYHVMTHKHNFDHMSILAQGSAIVNCDGVQTLYHAPAVIEIKAGVNHEVIPVNGDCVWFCIHNLDTVEDREMWHPDKIDVALIEHMTKMDLVVNVEPLNKEIHDNPELWNRYTFRTQFYDTSPHREVDDIWIRYRDYAEFDEDDPQVFSGPHQSVWYAAYYHLPAIKSIIDEVMATMPNALLGGVLITRIPPGKQVYRHSDAGSWHSEYYGTKVLILLESAPGQTFCFDNKSYSGKAGECFKFNNLVDHWVENNSDVDRVSLILAVKEYE